MSRRRVDTLLAERGLASSRSSAAAAIRAGSVRLGQDGRLLAKPGELVADDADFVLDEGPRYVSRGGIKLANALDALAIDVTGRACLDVGASTGGFTDCLLQRGASRVIALDVGYGQLDWALRNDERVEVLERVNARDIDPGALPFVPELAVVDVSFISLRKLLAPIARRLAPRGELLALVKPQFELGRGRVGKGGVVRSVEDRREALLAVAEAAQAAGFSILGFAPSGLPGPKGNRETFVHAALGGAGLGDVRAAVQGVDA